MLQTYNNTHISCSASPLCAVVVTWFTVTLSVGVFKNQPLLSIIYSSGTRRHAVRTISKVGTCHTFICTLLKKGFKYVWEYVEELKLAMIA